MMEIRVNILAALYGIQDHLHGRLPVYTCHSKSRVVKCSHLSEMQVEGDPLHEDEISHIQSRKSAHHFHKIS
jgi:hypothetical protein